MLVGSADDWTPAAPCRTLASARPAITFFEFDGAHHGFDGTQPVRLRTDVPGGAHPGQGVHVGGDAAARDAALRRLDDFLRAAAALR
jgi:dienelactone hydrolase